MQINLQMNLYKTLKWNWELLQKVHVLEYAYDNEQDNPSKLV